MTAHAATQRKFSAVDGVLLLDKATGITSNRALQQVRRLFGAAKAGHTGTLDPLCSGLLPVCFGEATKFSGYQLAANKRYEATLRLGITTTTGDAEGEVLQRRHVAVDHATISSVLAACRGPQLQIPPMYSALKREGKPLYEYARAGIELVRAPRAIEIFELKMLERADDTLVIDVLCSKGAYIRVLAETIGEKLGCGANLAALRRTASGAFSVATAKTFAQLDAMDATQRFSFLLAPDSLLLDLASITLDAESGQRFMLGQAVASPLYDDRSARVYAANGKLLGVGISSAGKLAPKRLVSVAANSIQQEISL